MRFLDVKTDFAFKKVFGSEQSKPILISKELDELTNIGEKWVYFVKNAGRLDYVPDTLKAEQCIVDAFNIANRAGLTEEELEAQEKRHDFILLQRGSIDKAVKDAVKGTSLEIARNLLDILDDTTIAQKTGLTVGEVNALR